MPISGGDRSRRVIRGGSWGNSPDYCRAAYRNWNHTYSSLNNIGFRVAQ